MNQQNFEKELLELKQSQKRLLFYFLAVFVVAFSAVSFGIYKINNPKFAEIDVQRINIKEPDGTIRLTISNRSLFPGAFFKNKEIDHPRAMAGMLFFNDEGTENGGFIFNGKLKEDGQPSSGLSLTFDRYQQDQQMQLLGVDAGGKHFAGLTFNDVVDGLDRPVFSNKDEQLSEQGIYPITKRVFLGKKADKNSTLQLFDANGNSRLELKVTPEGNAEIAFLDETGKPLKTITAIH